MWTEKFLGRRRPDVVLIAVVAAVVVGSCRGGDLPSCVKKATTTDSGLVYEDIFCGSGVEATKGSSVTVHYLGRLANGKVFESSRRRAQPVTFRLGAGQVIQGWDQGIPGMRVGGRRRLVVPPELAYGDTGLPPLIPPDATLVFVVQLLKVVHPSPQSD